MDKELLEKKLENKSINKGKDLKYKHIKKIAKKYDLSFDAVYDRAKELQGSGDLKIADNVSSKVRAKQGIFDADPAMSQFLDGIPSFDDILKSAGVDKDRLYKGYEQEKLNKAIRKAGEKFQRPQLSDEELFKRMEINPETQERLDKYDQKYGSRFGQHSGKLLRDADGNNYEVNKPKYKNLGEMGGNKDKLKAARKQMKTFEQGGGFQPANMTTKSASKYKKKGASLLNSIKI